MNRLKAAGIHILISFFIVTIIVMTMLLLWYPNAYFALMGGKNLIITLACVDVFLGPLLTLAIFKAGKKGLKFDLFCIGLVQIVALSYGVYVMFQARPVFTVFNKSQFDIAAVVDIGDGELAKGRQQQWRKFPITGPELVGIYMPDKKNKFEHMFAIVESASAYRYPRLYDDYKLHRKEVVAAGKPLTKLYEGSAKNKVAINHFIKQSKRSESDFLFVPISSELAAMSVIVDAKTGDFIEIIDAVQSKSK